MNTLRMMRVFRWQLWLLITGLLLSSCGDLAPGSNPTTVVPDQKISSAPDSTTTSTGVVSKAVSATATSVPSPTPNSGTGGQAGSKEQLTTVTTQTPGQAGTSAARTSGIDPKNLPSGNAKFSPSSTSGIDPKNLPLGDGKISQSPKKGYIYACQTNFNGGGASKDGEWIHGNTWDATAKIQVQGDVSWSQAKVSFVLDGGRRIITGNGLPSHNTGTFPIAQNDPAYQYDRNPNHISSYNVLYVLPANPVENSTPGCLNGGPIGFSLSGVAIFDGLDAGGRDAVAHEIQDKCQGHPEKTGVYHYHSFSSCITPQSGSSGAQLIGYALDGFGIFSNSENGKEITNADLDECHGRTSEIDWDGKKVTMYHYYATREYPYTLGCFKGSPMKTGQSGNQGQPNMTPGNSPAPGGGALPGGGPPSGKQPPAGAPPGKQPPAGPPPGGTPPPGNRNPGTGVASPPPPPGPRPTPPK